MPARKASSSISNRRAAPKRPAGWSKPPTWLSRISGRASCAVSVSTIRRCRRSNPTSSIVRSRVTARPGRRRNCRPMPRSSTLRRAMTWPRSRTRWRTATYAFGAIMAALYQRQLTGAGQMIDVSMLESMLSLTLSEIQAAQFAVAPPSRPIFGPIATKDGYIMPAIASERTFQNLAIASGHPGWITDPRFAEYGERRKHWGELVDELEAWSTALTTAEVQAIFDRHGVPSSPYRTVKQAMADPQLAHRRA